MFCVSLNFHNTEVSLREQFPYGEELLKDLTEGVFLSTCNRVEVYGVGDLYQLVNSRFRDFKTKIFIYEDELAIRHLYKVAAGLDSMVLGEDEILGQLRDAYERARAIGKTGTELNPLFQGALAAAKRIKTETVLSRTSVSVATLAASACVRFWEERQQVLGTERRARILMIGGSGDIGGKLLKDLLSYDRFDIAATVREHGVRKAVRVVDYKDRYSFLKDADIVISATKSPHFTVTLEAVEKFEGKEGPHRLYVDLAVPRDIDPLLSPVLTIDDLQHIARQNNELKQSAAREAELILEEELETLFKDRTFRRLLPLLEAPSAGDPALDPAWRPLLYAFREEASAKEFSAFTNVLLRMADETKSSPET